MIYWDNYTCATTENTTVPRHPGSKPAAPAAPLSIATLGTQRGDTRAETKGCHGSGRLREVTLKQRLEGCSRLCGTQRADTESRDQREAPEDPREVKPEERPEG